MPGFVQIIEFDASDIEAFRQVSERMQAERGDDLLARSAVLTEDRDRPGHYMVIVHFDSYEEAMRNSNDPVTTKYSGEMAAAMDGLPRFHNLDVRDVMR